MHRITEESLRNPALLQSIPKSDLHSHAGRGGNIAYLSKHYQVSLEPPKRRFADLSDMQAWFEQNIKSVCKGVPGYVKRLEAAFSQAHHDGVTVLAMSFGKGEIDFLGGMEPFLSAVGQLQSAFAPKTLFLPELAIGREQKEEEVLAWLEELLHYGWFKSIDLCNDEFAQPIRNFMRVYQMAERHKLRLKAHVGEFGSADDVMEAVETLHLHEVHHGIAAAESAQIMAWLARHRIQLNVCPTSNVMLGRVKDYQTHPIQRLFRHGVPVTINTDDMLIFNSSVSQEYWRLFHAGVLTCDALEQIRIQGLSANG